MPRDAKAYYPNSIPLAALGGAPRRFDLGDGVEAVGFLRDGRPVLYRDLCPHMGAPLSEGTLDARAGTLACPWHGYEFDADGGAFRRNPNDALFSCMKGLYVSHDPAAAPALRLRPLQYELESGALSVRRP